jgi:hypothetical protein
MRPDGDEDHGGDNWEGGYEIFNDRSNSSDA